MFRRVIKSSGKASIFSNQKDIEQYAKSYLSKLGETPKLPAELPAPVQPERPPEPDNSPEAAPSLPNPVEAREAPVAPSTIPQVPRSPSTSQRALANMLARSETNGRGNNEDSYFATALRTGEGEIVHVLAVADGMGGHEHGELVSREALRRAAQLLFEAFVWETSSGPVETSRVPNVEEVLKQTLQVVNSHIGRMIKKNGWGRAGSTIAIAVIRGNVCSIANLGDSPIFHRSEGQGTLHQLTDDHTVAGAMVRAGQISEAMGRHHEQSSVLEFFVGRDRLPSHPPVTSFDLALGDLLLLCSDGIVARQTTAEIAEVFESPCSLAELADRLILRARAKGEEDNQTVVLWRHVQEADFEPGEAPT